jgi:hypothetical protein
LLEDILVLPQHQKAAVAAVDIMAVVAVAIILAAAAVLDILEDCQPLVLVPH